MKWMKPSSTIETHSSVVAFVCQITPLWVQRPQNLPNRWEVLLRNNPVIRNPCNLQQEKEVPHVPTHSSVTVPPNATGSYHQSTTAAAHLIVINHWVKYIDPVMSLLLVVIMATTTWPLFKQSSLILLQTVPKHIELERIKNKWVDDCRFLCCVTRSSRDCIAQAWYFPTRSSCCEFIPSQFEKFGAYSAAWSSWLIEHIDSWRILPTCSHTWRCNWFRYQKANNRIKAGERLTRPAARQQNLVLCAYGFRHVQCLCNWQFDACQSCQDVDSACLSVCSITSYLQRVHRNLIAACCCWHGRLPDARLSFYYIVIKPCCFSLEVTLSAQSLWYCQTRRTC